MTKRKICCVLISLAMILCLLPFASASADLPIGTEYSVTLSPGNGTGSGQTYLSVMQGFIPKGRENAGNCEFYYEADGTMGFKTEAGWYPSDWAPPADGSFRGWSDGTYEYHSLNEPSLTLTANWGDGLLVTEFSLEIRSNGVLNWYGETEIPLLQGACSLGNANELYVEFHVTPLTDGAGNAIPVQIYVLGDSEQADSTCRMELDVSHIGVITPLMVRIEPVSTEDARREGPGTYTGVLEYTPVWTWGGHDMDYGTTQTFDLRVEILPLGDIDGDGKVNLADVTLLAKFVKAHGSGVEIVSPQENIDGDVYGKITTADVVLLAKYVKARGQGVTIN